MVITTRQSKRKRQQEEAGKEQQQHTEPRRRKLLLGSKVEVRSLADGFLGSWHSGKVVAYGHACRVVKYDYYFKDNSYSEKLKEKIYVSPLLEGISLSKDFSYRGIIRPIPPPCRNESIGLTFGLCVDAFIEEGWWEGVIFDYEFETIDDDRIVFFPDFGDHRLINTDKLRVTQDWEEVEERWIVRGKWKFLELIEESPNAVDLAGQIWIWNELRRKEEFKNNIKEWTCKVKSKWVGLVAETISQYLDESAKQVCIYSVNDEECGTNLVSSCDGEDDGEIDDGAQAIVVRSDNLTYSELSLGHRASMGLSQKRIQTQTDWEPTGVWLPDILPEPRYIPEALKRYAMPEVRKVQKKGCRARDLQIEAKMHLSYMGWGIEYKIRAKGKGVDFRYISPNGGKRLYSLRSACQQAMELARCRQDPVSMICEKDQGCASPPPLCLEQDYSVSAKPTAEEPKGSGIKLKVKLKKRKENADTNMSIIPAVVKEERLEWNQVPEQQLVVGVGEKDVVDFVAPTPVDVTTIQDVSDQDLQTSEPCTAKKFLLDYRPQDTQVESGDFGNCVLVVYNENQHEKESENPDFDELCTWMDGIIDELPIAKDDTLEPGHTR